MEGAAGCSMQRCRKALEAKMATARCFYRVLLFIPSFPEDSFGGNQLCIATSLHQSSLRPPPGRHAGPPQAGKQAGRQAGWQAFFLSDVTEAGIAPAQQAGRQADELENMATEAPGAEETVHRRYTMIMYGFWEIHTKIDLKTMTLKHVKRTRHQTNLKTTTLKHVKRTP